MSRPAAHSVPNCLRALATLIALAAVVAAFSPAQAGFGDLVKKAKDKAAQAVGKKPEQTAPADPGAPPVFDDTMIELTEARVSRIATALQASAAISAGRPALVEKVNQAIEERAAIEEKQGDAMMKLRGKRADVETCLQEGYNEARERRTAEYTQRAMTDPALREKFMKAAAQHNAAAAAGDSAAIQKLQEILHSEFLPTREDSAAVVKKCGAVPPPSPAELRQQVLDKDIAANEEKIRDLDKKAAEAQAEKSGLTEGQLAMALERIKMYLEWKKSDSSKQSRQSKKSNPSSQSSASSGSDGSSSTATPAHRGFTAEEIEAIEKHLETFRAAGLG